MNYSKEACMGCGLWVEKCPEGIISPYQDKDKSLPLDMDFVKERFADRAPNTTTRCNP